MTTVAELLQIKRRCPLTFTFHEASVIVGGGVGALGASPAREAGIDSAPCIGLDCTFFVPSSNPETGEIIGGNCAVPVLAVALSNQTAMMSAVAAAGAEPQRPFRRAPPLVAVPPVPPDGGKKE